MVIVLWIKKSGLRIYFSTDNRLPTLNKQDD